MRPLCRQVAFEHSYKSEKHFGVSGRSKCTQTQGDDEISQTAQAKGCATWPLNTRVIFNNGSDPVDFLGGGEVALTLREVIELAGAGGIDNVNYDASLDCRDVGSLQGVKRTGASTRAACSDLGAGTPDSPRYPRFRTTGMRLTVDLLYSNRQGHYDSSTAADAAPFYSRNVTAVMNVSHERVGWAGMGEQTFLLEDPTYSKTDGVESSAKLTRYRQGVMLAFRPSGKIYYFSPTHFFQTLLEGMLLIGLLKAVRISRSLRRSLIQRLLAVKLRASYPDSHPAHARPLPWTV